MLLLEDLITFADAHVSERQDLEKLFVLGEETEYAKEVKDVGNHGNLMSLVLVLPTYDSRMEDEDSREIGNNLYFMVVKNTDVRGKQEMKIEIFKKTQVEIRALAQKIVALHRNSGVNCLFKHIDLNSIRLDPVVNYHGTNGWELEFTTETQL
ncbi:hypothetical protein L0P88_03960 [Muricauda sp. SCSIO 64092]|uniref:hypothetical protein n=1 Tax=Allomuricauda sp. SCSIO 64092 TaxID=2908842 RepID=UPI001FF360C5|nr:hypothetical protein [Muricauda sp. SCSIO 64092]UOY07709.1 hypothetical protein L0P88_03960 [Muricauda sp. SCSIO 64092]